MLFFNNYHQPIEITRTDGIRFELVWLSTWLSPIDCADHFAIAKTSSFFRLHHLLNIGNICTSKTDCMNNAMLYVETIFIGLSVFFSALQIIMLVLFAIQKSFAASVNVMRLGIRVMLNFFELERAKFFCFYPWKRKHWNHLKQFHKIDPICRYSNSYYYGATDRIFDAFVDGMINLKRKNMSACVGEIMWCVLVNRRRIQVIDHWPCSECLNV